MRRLGLAIAAALSLFAGSVNAQNYTYQAAQPAPVQASPDQTGAANWFFSDATGVATGIKSNPGALYSVQCYSTAAAYILFFDSASNPALGALHPNTFPSLMLAVTSSSITTGGPQFSGFAGLQFRQGLWMAVSSAATTGNFAAATTATCTIGYK